MHRMSGAGRDRKPELEAPPRLTWKVCDQTESAGAPRSRALKDLLRCSAVLSIPNRTTPRRKSACKLWQVDLRWCSAQFLELPESQLKLPLAARVSWQMYFGATSLQPCKLEGFLIQAWTSAPVPQGRDSFQIDKLDKKCATTCQDVIPTGRQHQLEMAAVGVSEAPSTSVQSA